MARVISADEAANLVRDEETLLVCGCENLLTPETLLGAIERRFLATGSPRGLVEVHPIIHGMGEGLGLEHLAHQGLVARSIGSGFSYLKTSRFSAAIRQNQVEAYVLPMGVIFDWLRTIAAGARGLLTELGIGTFVDPRVEGGRMNAVSRADLARVVMLDGHEHLFYPAFRVDTALIRGTTADEDGNISLEREPVSLGIKTLAMAARASGGKVIAQVNRVAAARTLHPRWVEVPGVLVDYVVVANDPPSGDQWNCYLTGEVRMPSPFSIPESEEELARRIITRRAALEVPARKDRRIVVNLGVGMPVEIPAVIAGSGHLDRLFFFPEHGAIGGFPAPRAYFGSAFNPEAIIDSTFGFPFFQGGGLDIAFLGFGQIDPLGNVNVSKFADVMPGCGGFIDITHRTRYLVFCGTLTAGGLEVTAEDGRLRILREGKQRKVVPQMEQITLNGQRSLAAGQRVIYITERAVFELREAGLTVVELAPGISLESIQALLPPGVAVAGNLRTMDPALFSKERQ